jgi:hypothetical protein
MDLNSSKSGIQGFSSNLEILLFLLLTIGINAKKLVLSKKKF